MSDNSRHTTYIFPETVFSVVDTNPDFNRLRITGTTLGLTKGSSLSEEQRADRQIQDFRHGTEELGGDLNIELSYGSQDSLLEAALGGTWAAALTPIVGDTGISVNATNGFLHATTDWDTLGLVVGMRITVTGFTDPENNGTFTVTTLVGTQMTVAETTLSLVPAGDAVGITSPSALSTGVTRRSFSILRHFTDQTDTQKPYHVHTGVEVNTMGLNITPDARVTGTFGITGQTVDPKNDAEWATVLGTGSLGTASTTKVFDAFTGTITEAGGLNACVTELSLSLENGLESRFVVGSRTSKRPSIGRSNLTGTVTVYFEDASLLEKFYDETETSLEFTLVDAAGNSYSFVLPAIVFSGGQPDSSGTTGSITLALPFQAVYDEDAGTNLLIERNPA